MEETAEEAAEYLAEKQWGNDNTKTKTNWEEITQRKILKPLDCRTTPITVKEVKRIMKMAKTGKAPGPNQIPSEAWKWLGTSNIKYIVTLFNGWFDGEKLPDEALQATVVQIFKKGDSTNHANYRP